MNSTHTLKHEFVEFIPDHIEEGKLYISIQFATAVHKCCCGCGREVITPIAPTDWTLIFDGRTVSLDPSVGNWSFPCRSHYWIKRNTVRWAGSWSDEPIQLGRENDMNRKCREFEEKDEQPKVNRPEETTSVATERIEHFGLWARLRRYLRRN
ncbi:MAG: DUF6527 family protein [Solirubrobacterales bacterium]